MTSLERTEQLKERWFWSMFIIASVLCVYLASTAVYRDLGAQNACRDTCQLNQSKLIDDRCHCRIEGGWREALPVQVRDEL